MMNYVWAGMIILSVIFGFVSGNIEKVSGASIEGAKSAVELLLGMGGIIILWTGLIKIAEKAGVMHFFAKLLSPLLKFLFPSLREKNEESDTIAGAISMNMSANILGLGNAATPLGIKSMQHLKQRHISLGGGEKTASAEMIMLAIINTASIQLIPTTIMAIRASAGSKNPGAVIPSIILSSFSVLIFCVMLTKMCEKIYSRGTLRGALKGVRHE